LRRLSLSIAASIHDIGVASGTDALVALPLRALGIGPGDEVIPHVMTFAGSVQAILQCDARPRVVEVDTCTRCIDRLRSPML
jgi:dTDP-4-amino-4,6-dideoxygalactose transaminase